MSLIEGFDVNQMSRIAQTLQHGYPEADVNGVWNSILSERFLHPHFIIKPEEKSAGGRPDLTISYQEFPAAGGVDWSYHLIYEGKLEKNVNISTWRWTKVGKELYDYANALSVNEGQRVYCVGAIGKRVAFWHFRKGDYLPMKPVSLGETGILIDDRDVLPPIYDICDDAQIIHLILREMVTTFP
ncbi:hypothetical protein BDV93DRAFT_259091 [Ceratobasidium sp. AG-I]|nr:hypothetical protein BDV93DRAFT_259091 [Ceratobasidium sp. AG-I]